jgi:hypothetical protein
MRGVPSVFCAGAVQDRFADPEVTPIEKEARDAEALPLLTLMRSNEPLYQRPTIARRDA